MHIIALAAMPVDSQSHGHDMRIFVSPDKARRLRSGPHPIAGGRRRGGQTVALAGLAPAYMTVMFQLSWPRRQLDGLVKSSAAVFSDAQAISMNVRSYLFRAMA